MLVPETARAHLSLTNPPSRHGQNVLKTGPCGMVGSQRTANVTTYTSGETIVLEWNEYVEHPGHYRVAFDDDGANDFVDPPCTANCDTLINPVFDFDTSPTILIDNIPDRNVNGGNRVYRQEVTLPDIECANCTLQVIQVMYDKPPYTIGGNDLYYQCADLILARGPGSDAGVVPDGGNPPDTGIVPPDTGVVPPDTGIVLPDTGVAPDAGPPAQDGGLTVTEVTGGLGCSTSAPVPESRGPVFGLMVGVLLAVLRRRV